ncbi:MAG TPA: gamma-glutamyltransferase [Casimicrobiaceae bacterium]|nr:gamma-glutamyltransferase [Casimicrobiaceae bacterium]
MTSFNVTTFNSRRSPVFARRGIIATAHPLASLAGMRMLIDGGSAADAAVAAAAVLGVVEPYQTGLGGDAFALIYRAKDRRAYALNASGPAPAAATLERYRAQGLDHVPPDSPLAWTVPGCVDGWSQMLERHGRFSLREVLQPAIGYAADGFPVAPGDAVSWRASEAKLRGDSEAARTLLIDGRAPCAGDVLVQPDLARTLQRVADGGRDAFYAGEIADELVAYVRRRGGLITNDDLARYRAEWQEPIGVDYRGHRVLECPPNGQGVAALLALRAVSTIDLARHRRDSPECWHLLIEATKQAMVDAQRQVADPRFADVPIEQLLADARAPTGWRASVPQAAAYGRSDTVYLAVVDGEGNGVSFINSVFADFGSGHVAERLGFVMQNRGAGFSLDPAHPNRLAPGKRPFHTIIPGMVLRGDALHALFGVSGGLMQPQGHLQLIVSLLDYGLDVQSAVDFPRFWWEEGRRVVIEAGAPDATCETLAAWGHAIQRREHRGMGGAQIISALPGGVWVAGSEPRQDGCAIGF